MGNSQLGLGIVWGEASQREKDSRGGVEVTAEECLLCSLFAMVSSDCHVRNALASTTGLGMLLSETSLAYEIWNLHLSTEPVIHLYTLYRPVHAVCIWENQSVSVNHITKGTFDLEMTKSYIKPHS